MTVELNVEEVQAGFLRIDIQGQVDVAALLGEVLNPEGQDLHIIEGYLYFQTPSAAAATMNIGIGASEADTSDLMSAQPMNSAAGKVFRVIGTDLASEGDMVTPQGVNWDSDEYLTITTAAQISTACRAVLLLKYLRLEDLAQ